MSDTGFQSERDKALNIQFRPFEDPVINAYKKDLDMGALRRNLELSVEERVTNFIRNMEAIYELRRAGEKLRAQEQAQNGET